MEKIGLAILLLLPFSLAGLAMLVGQTARSGGAVRTPAFSRADLVLAIFLSSFFALLSWSGFHAPHREITTISLKLLWSGEILQLSVVAGVLFSLYLRRVPFQETFGTAELPPLRAFVYALGWAILVLPVIATVMTLVATQLPKQDIEEQILVSYFRSEVRQHHYAGMVSLVITAAVLAPAMEEFIFRGYLYPVLKRYLSGLGSAALTALLFAALHANVAALGGLFVLALLLTAAYEWSGSILLPIGIHAIFNGLNMLVMYLGAVQPSP